MNNEDYYIATIKITEVINRYFAALDDKELSVASLSRIFSNEGKVIRPNGAVMTGPEVIAESHTESLIRFRATQHTATGFIITPVSDAEARFRANLVALHVWADGYGDPTIDPNENYFLAGGVLTGRVVMQEDGWRIAEIANKVTWRRGTGFQEVLKTK